MNREWVGRDRSGARFPRRTSGLSTLILEALAGVGVDAYGLKMHANWESIARDKVIARLEKASHFLALATRDEPRSLLVQLRRGLRL